MSKSVLGNFPQTDETLVDGDKKFLTKGFSAKEGKVNYCGVRLPIFFFIWKTNFLPGLRQCCYCNKMTFSKYENNIYL